MTTGLVDTVPKLNNLRTVPSQIHGLSCTSLTGAKVALAKIRIHFVLTTSSVKTPQSNSCSFRTLHHLHELTKQKPFRARRPHVASSTLRTSLPDRIWTLRPCRGQAPDRHGLCHSAALFSGPAFRDQESDLSTVSRQSRSHSPRVLILPCQKLWLPCLTGQNHLHTSS